MSINWSKQELVARLVKHNIAAAFIREGDIIVEDHGPWQVSRIETKRTNKRDTKFYFYDCDENGGGPYDPTHLFQILPRAAVKGTE